MITSGSVIKRLVSIGRNLERKYRTARTHIDVTPNAWIGVLMSQLGDDNSLNAGTARANRLFQPSRTCICISYECIRGVCMVMPWLRPTNRQCIVSPTGWQINDVVASHLTWMKPRWLIRVYLHAYLRARVRARSRCARTTYAIPPGDRNNYLMVHWTPSSSPCSLDFPRAGFVQIN